MVTVNSGVEIARLEWLRAVVEFLGRGQQAPPHQSRGAL